MPRRDDLESILIIGSGPIVIGQACEFDYSGTQACRVLREEGYRVILANSNPATIMTDPDFADATYVEPLVAEVLERILDREQPDAVLPTLGGQTALNLAMELSESGALERRGIELIGAKAEAIATAEDRDRFKTAMLEIGLDVPASGIAHDMDEARSVVGELGLPVVIRPAYILGGKGTGIAATAEEFERLASLGLEASPISEILIERSIAGWKEFELEVMRDRADNCVVICSIENFDPMGVHTGDSITVAPAQTLTDVEYQQMRDAAFACIRRVGVETGGSNVQFAVDPNTGDQVVIEMNPRVSRSSALASKATGFPIAKIAAKLAVGYTLDEIPNDITRKTPASFEPTIDYVVTKVPRWAFEKLPGAEARLGTQMQSVGEVMALGRTFPESLQKAMRSLEQGRSGLNQDPGEKEFDDVTTAELLTRVAVGSPERILGVESLLRRGVSVEDVADATRIDPWFLDQILSIIEERQHLEAKGTGSEALAAMTRRDWRRAKRLGFGDAQLAYLWDLDETTVRTARLDAGVEITYKTVDTCGAEFEATTPYHYGTYEDDSEVAPSDREKVIILGSGPNRIGQGIEFDYCCVHACFALADAGYETVMVNCNPETVSTDYDTSDRLYFEPLSAEGVLNVIDAERRSAEQGGGSLKGVIVSLGGQTPLKLANVLPPELVLGTAPASIDAAEDRDLWGSLCARLEIPQPAGGTATTLDGAREIVERIGYPALVRPSYVLGGRAMEIVYDDEDLERAWGAIAGSGSLGREGGLSAERPVLIDRFLEDATEVDVDAIRDHTGEVIIGGIMEHVEEAGVHSGDSACVIPPIGLSDATIAVLEESVRAIAEALDVRGLINVQFAVKRSSADPGSGQVFVIEANPRASRTVPFVAKATGVPLVKVAARVMCGATLAELREEGLLVPKVDGDHVAVKEAVLPFNRFPDVDAVLGPEMRSTGEVMGIDSSAGMAFAKAQLAAGDRMPTSGTVFFSLADRDKPVGLRAAQRFQELGFDIVATSGTAALLRDGGVEVERVVAKLQQPDGSAAVDGGDGAVDGVELIAGGQIDLVVNSPRGRGPRADGAHLRRAAAEARVPLLTTAAAALAAANGIAEWISRDLTVRSLQSYHGRDAATPGVG
ncbi:carbamoyl-phosphate synthase large subunit [Dermatobacter hominis]|uniref:carbamoyl-phosphate synthase large subunit n=1 Tax=Dermatobacter hominis TaxID=2884263 RepID=UPI001D115890|nr:carbamoyl-phosphate synthase large subunit [Dermatobacter hominis]UDY36195.1 carbamoyl-phosphate synthase large subunit [Dermatobacter hominis]